MSSTVTVSEARAILPEILTRVSSGEEVTVTRYGTPIAVIVSPDVLRVRRADHALAAASEVRDVIDRGRRSPLAQGDGLSEQRADELAGNVHAARARS